MQICLIPPFAKFASQLKSSSGGQGDSSESTQYVPSDEKDPSDHDDHSEGRDLASVEELSEAPGDPQLENLVMTEEEQTDFETFTLASPNAPRGKTSWKASQENTKFYSQAQQARHKSESLVSQERSLGSVNQGQVKAFVSSGSGSSPGSTCRPGPVPCPAASRSRSATSGSGSSWRPGFPFQG